MFEGDCIDYKSVEKVCGLCLEVLFDLIQLQCDNCYVIFEVNKGVVIVFGYQLEQQNKLIIDVIFVVLMFKGVDVCIECDGLQCWLVVKQILEQLWLQIKDFWQDNGFLINIELFDIGVMEIDWVENCVKILQDFICNMLGKVFDLLYFIGECDKFCICLECGLNGIIEIFISYCGVEEVLIGLVKEILVWIVCFFDLGLEVEFLFCLMVCLGVEEIKVKVVVVNVFLLQVCFCLQKIVIGISV